MALRVKRREQSLGELLRGARDAADLSQVELSLILGVSGRTIQGWESGRIEPQPKHRRRIKLWLAEAADGKAA